MPEISIRAAGPHDVRAFWEWRNDEAARAASFHPEPLPFAEHAQWFHGRLTDACTLLYVVLDPDGASIGYVRFSLGDGEAEISIALEPATRGRGYGTAAIRRCCDLLLASRRATRIVARVKLDNAASRHAFARAGFVEERRFDVAGAPTLELACNAASRARKLAA